MPLITGHTYGQQPHAVCKIHKRKQRQGVNRRKIEPACYVYKGGMKEGAGTKRIKQDYPIGNAVKWISGDDVVAVALTLVLPAAP